MKKNERDKIVLHSTTADRAASDTGMVIASHHRTGYTMAEVHVPKNTTSEISLSPGASFYCLNGKGWASLPHGEVRYALAPGVVIAPTNREKSLVLEATQSLEILHITYSGAASPWAM
ncbi:hypothetical protein CQ020_20430 [Arthrobacter sp. MYb23]|nr:hypothetical protein CQ038_19635 [Arthrobacter sp. MYb51]PRB91567.1 hypothetical protein CQ020_20430 [Arthrobacter sp. MYb23]